MKILWFILGVLTSFPLLIVSELTSGRIKGRDEPQLVSWKVLEGITEPFGSSFENNIPVWKQMKASADQKAANMAMQQALHEYGQILRHPYVFGEMPAIERYDVFLSMAKLLKAMGFHQRAELMLHEAMTQTTNAYEANFQLALLFLDKEDLNNAKMYLKNCLFYQESDLVILSYLSIILLTEGRLHESTFFISRIMIGLEERVRKLSFVLSEQEIQAILKTKVDYKTLTTWLEDTIIKVFYGEFRITPLATIDLLKYFSNLYSWIQEGEVNGRFLFDLGQTLYENGGRSKIGLTMMKKGFETSSIETEGIVSYEIINLRLAFEYPIISDSIHQIIQNYLNITTFLSSTSKNYTKIDIENIMDMYWPIPLLGWSGLPIMPVVKELLWRFQRNLIRSDEFSSSTWLKTIENYEFIFQQFLERKTKEKNLEFNRLSMKDDKISHSDHDDDEDFLYSDEYDDENNNNGRYKKNSKKSKKNNKNNNNKKGNNLIPPANSFTLKQLKIEIGIFAGHLNNHPVGQMTLHNILLQLKDQSKNLFKSSISITLLSLPLFPDTVTKKIATKVDKILNIPMDTKQAIKLLETAKLDIILFPDWQAFPDQQSLVFQSMRIAPIQICYYIRGTSCASSAIDYYLLPKEIEQFYLKSVPAAANNAVRQMNVTMPMKGGNNGVTQKVISRPLRPSWRELFAEQVVLVDDWPLLTASAIESSIQIIQMDNNAMNNRKVNVGPSSSSSSSTSSASSTSASSSTSSVSTPSPSSPGHSGADMTSSLNSFAIMEDYFSPNEFEGKIFFKDQPVAILPIYPTYIHPLMDDILFKIMRSVPVLQILLVIPDSFLTHIRDNRHKLSWARRLVRRLWDHGGSTLSHRIRLLPSTLSDYRLLQLIRQTDLVLDTFPIGSSSYFLGLALSVGTPVITLRTGAILTTPKDDYLEVKQYLSHAIQAGYFKDHPLRLLLNSQLDIPWIASISNIVGFYERVSLDQYFVANSTMEYFNLALKLLSEREYAYELRVKLLDALDYDANYDNVEHKLSPGKEPLEKQGLAKTLYELGLPWANARQNEVIAVRDGKQERFPNRKKQPTAADTTIASSSVEGSGAITSEDKKSKKSATSGLGDFGDFLKSKIGTIVQ